MHTKIKKMLEDKNISICDRYLSVYREYLSKEKKDNYLVFKEIIEESSKLDNRDAKEEFEIDPMFRKVASQYVFLLKEMVASIAKLNLIPEDFYERLYTSIFRSNIFPEKELERSIILYLLSNRFVGLPYYQATDPVVLEEAEFDMLIREIQDELDKARYMMLNRFNSRSEEASQLCDIADSLDSREKKAVFWACVMQTRRPKRVNDKDNDDQ